MEKEGEEWLNHFFISCMKTSSWFQDESGQALSEYGLLIALIAVVAVAAIATFGGKIKTAFETLSSKF